MNRLDGFDGPIEVEAANLPPGITATSAVIDRGELSGNAGLDRRPHTPLPFRPRRGVSIARAMTDSSTSPAALDRRAGDRPRRPVRWLDHRHSGAESQAGGAAAPGRDPSRPAGLHDAWPSSAGRAFKGRVPIEVKNLPQGVRVLNIGLNGVLITEAQSERTVSILAEPWAQPMIRPFYAVGKAESAGTEDSSPPIELVVLPAQSHPVNRSAARGKPEVSSETASSREHRFDDPHDARPPVRGLAHQRVPLADQSAEQRDDDP